MIAGICDIGVSTKACGSGASGEIRHRHHVEDTAHWQEQKTKKRARVRALCLKAQGPRIPSRDLRQPDQRSGLSRLESESALHAVALSNLSGARSRATSGLTPSLEEAALTAGAQQPTPRTMMPSSKRAKQRAPPRPSELRKRRCLTQRPRRHIAWQFVPGERVTLGMCDAEAHSTGEGLSHLGKTVWPLPASRARTRLPNQDTSGCGGDADPPGPAHFLTDPHAPTCRPTPNLEDL